MTMPALDRDRPRMRLVSFKPLAKGALRGFAHIELPNALRIADCPVLTSNGKAWATLPWEPVLYCHGKHVEVSGKEQYAPSLEWRDRALQGFGGVVVQAVEAAYGPIT